MSGIACVVGVGLLCASLSQLSLAQEHYPAKVVRLVVPFPPGGGTDILGRIMASRMSVALGQQVLVENRPGAGGIVATELVAKSPADGYTLLLADPQHLAINPALHSKLPYDAIRDFEPITLAAYGPLFLAVHSGVAANNFAEFTALAKARPGKLSYGSAGSGSIHHLSMESLKAAAGLDIVHVPFKGSSEAITALIAGQVPVAFVNFPEGLPFASSGRVRALAVAAGRRYETLPEVPTMAEAGYPGFEANIWFGIVAPAATPRDTVLRLNAEINRILGIAEVQKMFRSREAQIEGGTPERFAEHLRKMVSVWAKVVREAKIKAE
jgi:tripartite-type tricarboxylate transporter receptor subunit TctC